MTVFLACLVGCAANPTADSAATTPAAAKPTAIAQTPPPAKPTTIAGPTTPSPVSSATPKPAPSTPEAGVAARRPFPQHTTYTAGVIKPNQHAQETLDAAVRGAYRLWKLTYLKNGCGTGQFHIDPGADVSGNATGRGIAISEGQGYGMLIAAFMAGADPDAKRIFDGTYAYFRAHPSNGDPHLMAWKQVVGCVDVVPNQTPSATDGDMDVAYALLLADRQWGSDGPINYRQEALKIIAALKATAVNPKTHTLMMGDWVKEEEPQFYYGARTSDFMPEHLRVYAAATGDQDWNRVADASYKLIDRLQRTYSPNTGLLPDFVEDISGKPAPAKPNYIERDSDGRYAFNACRTPWRIATDYLISGDQRALAAVRPINRWVRASTGDNPQNIYSGYQLDGTAASNLHAVAFVAPVGVAAMVDADNQEWLNALWDQVAGSSTQTYYNDTLKLLGMIVMSGNWWSPERNALSAQVIGFPMPSDL